MSWGDPDSDIGQDLSVVCETGITRLVAPPWAYKLPSKKYDLVLLIMTVLIKSTD